MRYAVTGTTGLLADEVHIVHRAIEELDPHEVTEFTTGGAIGVDTVAAVHALETLGIVGITHRVILPAAPYCPYWDSDEAHGLGFVIVRMPDEGLSWGRAYMARNDKLVHHARGGTMLAFPKTSVEQQRSGTWATVRRARKAGVKVAKRPLRV